MEAIERITHDIHIGKYRPPPIPPMQQSRPQHRPPPPGPPHGKNNIKIPRYLCMILHYPLYFFS